MLAPEKISLTYSWHYRCQKNQVLHEFKIIKLILILYTCYFPRMCQNTLKNAFAQHNEKLTTLERFFPPLFFSRLCWSFFFFFFGLCRVLSCSIWSLSCCMWDLVPWPGIEPRPPASGVQSLSRWATREVPVLVFEMEVFVQTWAKPLVDGRCREEERGAGNSSAGRPHPFLVKVITFVRGACSHSVHA